MSLILKSNTEIGEYKLQFHSFRIERPVKTGSPEIVRGTKCTIRKKGDLVMEAEVSKSHKDVDSKILARQYAFKKAVSQLDAAQRKDFNSSIGSIGDIDSKIEMFNFLKDS